jgi:hypothetical protein
VFKDIYDCEPHLRTNAAHGDILNAFGAIRHDHYRMKYPDNSKKP